MSNPDKCSMTADLETSRDNLSERIATLEAENGRLTRERDEQREGAIGRGKFASEWRQNCEAARRRVAALERELDLVRSHLFSVAHALDIPEGESTETVAKKCVDALEVEFAETKALVSERNEWKDIAERVANELNVPLTRPIGDLKTETIGAARDLKLGNARRDETFVRAVAKKLNVPIARDATTATIHATILDQIDRWIEDETSRITGRAEALGRADRLTAALGHVADVLGVPREVDVGSQEARIVGAISKLKMSQIEPTDARRQFHFLRSLARRLHVAFPEGEKLAVIEANVHDAVERLKSELDELRADHEAGRETRNRYMHAIEYIAARLGVSMFDASGAISVAEFTNRAERELNHRRDLKNELQTIVNDAATALGVSKMQPNGATGAGILAAVWELKGKLGQYATSAEQLSNKLVKCEVALHDIATTVGVKFYGISSEAKADIVGAIEKLKGGDRVAFLRSLANRLYVPFEPPYDVVERGIMFELDRWVAGDAERRKRAAKMLDVVVGVADALGVSATGKFEDVKVRMVEAVGKLKSTRPLNLNSPSINIPGSFVMVDASQWRAEKSKSANLAAEIEKLKADTISADDWRKRCCALTDDLHKIRTALGLDGHIHSAERVLGAIQTVCENHHTRKSANLLKRIGDELGVTANSDHILKQIEYAAKQRAELAAIVESTCKALGVPSVGAAVDVQRGILATIEKMQPRPGDFVMMTALDADRLAKLQIIADGHVEFRDTLADILRSPSNREVIIERVRDIEARLRRAQAAFG